jgi:hypothetical protein
MLTSKIRRRSGDCIIINSSIYKLKIQAPTVNMLGGRDYLALAIGKAWKAAASPQHHEICTSGAQRTVFAQRM